MSSRQTRLSGGLFAGILGIGLTLAIVANQGYEPRAVETLLPADTILFLGHDGSEKHKAAWEQTAAHEAMYQSGLVSVLEKVVDWVGQQAPTSQHPEFEAALKHLDAHGATLAVSLPTAQGPPIPQITIVLHKAAQYAPTLSGMVRSFGPLIGAR